MTTLFDRAFKYTMKWEGGAKFTNDPDDPGGATKYGISLKFMNNDACGPYDESFIKDLDEHKAKEIYDEYFWNPLYDKTSTVDEKLMIKLFDFSVNMGVKRAVKLLQVTMNDSVIKNHRVAVDGIFGDRTLQFVNSINININIDIDSYENNAARYYFKLADNRKKSRKYLLGWLRRCYGRPS